jgi:hypothetical protein
MKVQLLSTSDLNIRWTVPFSNDKIQRMKRGNKGRKGREIEKRKKDRRYHIRAFEIHFNKTFC